MNGGRVQMDRPSDPTSRLRQPLRLGPRPLPQHLSLAAATWLNSAAILPALRLVSANWEQRPEPSPLAPNPASPPPSQNAPHQNQRGESLRQRWAALFQEAERTDPAALAVALQAEGFRRFGQLLTGIENYRHHPRHRRVPEAPVLWQQGTTKLRDYRTTHDKNAPRLLVIPSLVNRYYILDLETDASFLRWSTANGMAPFVIDWDAPGEAERGFDFADYILRLERALEAVAK